MDDLFSSSSGFDMDVDEREYGGYVDEEITQEDAWIVIDRYFDEKGLVRQQLDSFDEFITHTMTDLVQDLGNIVLKPENQYYGTMHIAQQGYHITFDRVIVSPPSIHEADEEKRYLYPQEARLRSLK